MEKVSMIPLYQQLADEIKQQISEGKLNPGDKMMTEMEFSEKFSVSRITVRKAIELLSEDGYVIKKQGIGTFVAEKKLRRVIDNRILSFTEMSERSGQAPSTELLSIDWKKPDLSVMTQLQLSEEEKVLNIVRLRKIDGVPVMIEDNYYRKDKSFLLQGNLEGSTYQMFRDHDLIPTHSVKTIELCYATNREAELLNVKKNQILMLQKDTTVDQNGNVLHFSKLLINSDRYLLTIVL